MVRRFLSTRWRHKPDQGAPALAQLRVAFDFWQREPRQNELPGNNEAARRAGGREAIITSGPRPAVVFGSEETDILRNDPNPAGCSQKDPIIAGGVSHIPAALT